MVHDGLNREYIVYVPASYTGDFAVPLVFNFHGYGGTASDHMNSGDMRPQADADGFILVYAQGAQDGYGFSHWNVEGPNSTGVDDLGFVEAMIDTISQQFMINQDRVYSCGYSNGGFLTYDLACRVSDRIAAIGAVASTMITDSFNECEPSHPTAVVTIHGTSDFVVSYDGFPPFTLSLDEVHEYWTDFNNIEAGSTMTDIPNTATNDGSTVELYSWADADGCVSIEHYKVIGGGHDWPGAWGNMDINSSQIIWDFVSQYDINGLIDCEANAIETDVESDRFRVFPNPTSEVISLQNLPVTNDTYQIYNTVGTLVQEGRITNTNQTISFKAVSPGIYLLTTAGITARIIKQD